MTKLDILQKEHDLLNEILSIAWEDENRDVQANVAFYACGIHDMASEMLKHADTDDICDGCDYFERAIEGDDE